jgi:protein TonB
MMKRGKTFKAIVVVCICLSVFTACESQMIDLASTRATTTTGSQTADSLFVDDEQPASFPGGQEALLAFLDQSVRYPEGYESCAQGRVVVRFTIDVDGSIVDPKVIRSLDPPLDKEALRVVSLMPKWIPAKEKGKNKRTEYILPILIKTK